MLHRPGPPEIEPGGAPGGLVFRIYDLSDRLVATDRIVPPDWQPTEETVEAARAAGDVCLVVYDGDTGVRWTDDDFRDSGMQAGQRFT